MSLHPEPQPRKQMGVWGDKQRRSVIFEKKVRFKNNYFTEM